VESRFEALHATGLTTLVGRDEECELLLRRWLRAKSGEGQIVLLSGDAGIGKSRLSSCHRAFSMYGAARPLGLPERQRCERFENYKERPSLRVFGTCRHIDGLHRIEDFTLGPWQIGMLGHVTHCHASRHLPAVVAKRDKGRRSGCRE